MSDPTQAPIALTGLLIPTFRQLLTALSGWLDKGEAHAGGDPRALLAARLAPDMLPLATQVRFACVQAYEAVHRLRGEAFPPLVDQLLEEGRAGADHPGGFADARARIADTLAFLGEVGPGALDQPGGTPVVHALPNGMTFDLTAELYGRDWVLGQFTFHVMMAYAILRHAGVPLGKADVVGHLLPHLRTAPTPPG